MPIHQTTPDNRFALSAGTLLSEFERGKKSRGLGAFKDKVDRTIRDFSGDRERLLFFRELLRGHNFKRHGMGILKASIRKTIAENDSQVNWTALAEEISRNTQYTANHQDVYDVIKRDDRYIPLRVIKRSALSVIEDRLCIT